MHETEAALMDAWELLATALPDAWTRRVAGALAGATGAPAAAANGLWAGAATSDPRAAAAALADVAATGLPHFLQLDPACSATESLRDVARSRGMTHAFDLPLMRLDGEVAPTAAGPLVVRRLETHELATHWELCARGFEAPAEVFAAMITPAVVQLPGAGAFVAEVDGEPVATGFHLVRGDSVGIFDIATPPEHRRRGYGAAVTAELVRAGRRAGASWAWLQSSPEVHRVYERLGFDTVAAWECWLTG